MISDKTMREVRELSIHQIVSPFVVLKRNTGCCPFHQEQTPSFHLNEKRNRYKCFGCGASGDGIQFIRQHEHLSFFDAVERIARDHNIELEYTDDSFSSAQREEQKSRLETYKAILDYCHAFYRDALAQSTTARKYLLARSIDDDIIEEWQLGYAPNQWQSVVTHLINRGWFEPALELGIIGSKDGRNYDIYRNRIMIPITDRHGQLVGFAGRILGDEKPKYINPCESELYNKSSLWFGWAQAIKCIAQSGEAIITEGYFDVISMHRSGVINTIASCGTTIDDKQWKLLKPHAKSIAIMYDGDNAGQNKIHPHALVGLKLGFEMKVIDVLQGADPDDIARQFHTAPIDAMHEEESIHS
jgi:DNA primase